MTCRKCSLSTPAITKLYMMLTNSLHRILAHLRPKEMSVASVGRQAA